MPRKKKSTAVQPSLFELEGTLPSQDKPEPEVMELSPGDAVYVDGDRSRQWLVARVIADHVAIWNETDADCVPIAWCERIGQRPSVVKMFAGGWLRTLIDTMGYWEVVKQLGLRQPKTARVKDPLIMQLVTYSTPWATYQEVMSYHQSDLEIIDPLINEFMEFCRDNEIPYEHALVAIYDRYFEVKGNGKG